MAGPRLRTVKSDGSLPLLAVCVQKPLTQADSVLGASSLHGHAKLHL